MLLTRTIAMTDQPVSLAEAKAHLRVSDTDEDALISALIVVASEHVAALTGLALGPETWVYKVGPQYGDLLLPWAPVVAVTAVGYYDPDGTAQVDVVGNYRVMADDRRPLMRPVPTKSWPATELREDAISITFTAGFSAVPAPLAAAIKMLVGHWFENRESVVTGTIATEIPLAAALVEPFRRAWVGA